MQGQTLSSQQALEDISLDLVLPAGMYFIKISGQGETVFEAVGNILSRRLILRQKQKILQRIFWPHPTALYAFRIGLEMIVLATLAVAPSKRRGSPGAPRHHLHK
ncbi:MAG: T9SS type A sorting domain-containing protein [Saprospirales bacterium]|nr:T9SS type A sorting domain-containing protein [Saprospirales bacterium]